MTRASKRYSTQHGQSSPTLLDASRARKTTTAAERAAAKARAKELRLSAQERVKAMPFEDRRLINETYRRERLTGKTNLPYPRWLVALFEQDHPAWAAGAMNGQRPSEPAPTP